MISSPLCADARPVWHGKNFKRILSSQSCKAAKVISFRRMGYVFGLFLVSVSAALAATVIVTVQGTVDVDGSDQATGASSGAFGPPGTLAGKPFTLTTTIDDTGGQPLVPNGSNTSSITNVRSAIAVLTIGGASITIGSLPTNTAEVLKSLDPADFEFQVSGSNSVGPSVSQENVGLHIVFASGSSPFGGNVDWHAPFAYQVGSNDQVVASFFYERAASTATVIASGGLIATSITVTSDGSAPSPITPAVGLWWNPDESGTGYALDYKHGVLVVTVYSYTASGLPLWYLASGAVTNNVFTATLDKYQTGQCISCAYHPATINGNDGTISITFTSPTSAMMTLPGGRSFQIVPQAF